MNWVFQVVEHILRGSEKDIIEEKMNISPQEERKLYPRETIKAGSWRFQIQANSGLSQMWFPGFRPKWQMADIVHSNKGREEQTGKLLSFL